MPNKVFRAHQTGQSGEDWFPSSQISKSQIEEITAQDMEGTKQPTSIPSPFARIDLVRVAFEKISQTAVDGKSDAHRLVSDALDIGQMFFNLERHQSHLSITRWEKTSEIAGLKNSSNKSHTHVGHTLDLYLKQDGEQYNFDRLENIFILKYKHKVVGGTSPRTLFFAAPRADKLNVEINFENDRVLDEEPLSLYKREESFVRFMFGLKNSTPQFSALFPEVSAYMQKNLDMLQSFNYELYNAINSRNLNFDDLDDLHLPGNEGITIQVLPGVPIKAAAKSNPDTSDFIVNTRRDIARKPLALPVGAFTQTWKYTSAPWNPNTKVSHYYAVPIESRTLPDQGIKYPFLTQNDLLAPVIVKLPYEMDSDHFFTAGSKNFMLPLTNTFFKYFSVKDIFEGKVKIEVDESEAYGGITTVKLTIPVKDGKTITYRKKYEVSELAAASVPEEAKNGLIFQADIAMAFTPFYQAELIRDYTFSICSTNPALQIEMEAFKDENSVSRLKVESTVRSNLSSRKSTHYKSEEGFSFLEFSLNGNANYILPRWRQKISGNVKHEFAIDFGTTNTHIELKIDGIASSKPIEFLKGDNLLVFLRKGAITSGLNKAIVNAEEYLTQESFPIEIHSNTTHNFPVRTVLFENKDVNYQKSSSVFLHANIGFDYEKRKTMSHLSAESELKWSDLQKNANRARILRFLEELFILCRNKVLADGGNMNETKFCWFYPISMTGAHKNSLSDIWKEAYSNVFTGAPSTNLREVSESIAPFFYYHQQEGITALAAPAVSIDIGGGTSDVVIYSDAKPSVVTSFRFAGNSIFGDGLNQNQSNNGFVNLFKEKYRNKLEENDISSIFDEHFQVDRSSDLVNFLFSLSQNDLVKERRAPINFEQELKENQELKIVFLIFFSALFYHIAQLCKANGLKKPRNFLFSGRGSKTLFILNGTDGDLGQVNKLLSAVFDNFYPDDKGKVEITIATKPKEITSKGGLLSKDVGDLESKIQYHLGGKEVAKIQKPFVASAPSLNFKSYYDNESMYLKDVLQNLDNFCELLESINAQGSIFKTFGISPSSRELFNEILNDKQLMQDFIQLGVNRQLEEVGDKNEAFEETLFFYPFIGALNKLAFEISKSENN
jgi:hypothetical protein